MSIWNKIPDECFKHLAKDTPQRVKAEDNRIQSKTSNVYLIKWQVSVFTTESTKIQETTLRFYTDPKVSIISTILDQ